MDNLAIQAAEAAVHANYPNCGGLLLVELDGPVAEVEALMTDVNEICRSNGAWEIRIAQSEAERALIWKGRKSAFAAWPHLLQLHRPGRRDSAHRPSTSHG